MSEQLEGDVSCGDRGYLGVVVGRCHLDHICSDQLQPGQAAKDAEQFPRREAAPRASTAISLAERSKVCVLPETSRTEVTVTDSSAQSGAGTGETEALTFDPSVPNPARMWNYWVGGKDNYAADRAAAEAVIAAFPALPVIARQTRRFLVDVVQQLAGTYGVRQFLDIGTGLPTAENTHEVAQRVAPDSRVVYVDHDPVVLAHARALLTSTPGGKTDFIQADLRDTGTILAQAARTVDFSQPVAILLVAVLHFIGEDDDPYAIVARLMDAVPAGSYLVIAHAASDIRSADTQEGVQTYNERSPVRLTPRSREQTLRLVAGLDPVGRGVVPMSQWFEQGQGESDGTDLVGYCGLVRKR